MLISTKLKPPSVHSRMLFRKDLIKRLCAAEGYPFVLLSGPAGSGKTSLICQWPLKGHLRAAWYSLDQEDNDPDLFYRYLLAAFIQADKGLKAQLGPMLGTKQQLTSQVIISLIIESLSGTGRKFRLILDDVHHIKNNEILDALARFIKYAPTNLQFVFLSRYPLHASLGSAAYKKEFLEISALDLKFTEMETAELFEKVIPLSISADQIRALNQYVEGWAAGLQLIGLKVKSKGDHFDLSKILNQAHEQIAGYLVHDILSAQPEKIRNFVYATALLARFNPEVCIKVTGQNDAAGILAHLESMHLFLIPLDDNGNWYRYHHMFSEAVQHQVLIDNPDLISTTLRTAAMWFAANNFIEDAARSAFRSGDLNFAADLLEDHTFQYIIQVDPMTGLRWISHLPPDILNPRILLRLQQCLNLISLMEFSKAREILASIESLSSRALQGYSDKKRRFCEDYIIFLNCILKTLNVNQSADIPNILSMGKKISTPNSIFSMAIKLNAVFSYIAAGDLDLAETFLARVYRDTTCIDVMTKKIFLDKAKALIARHRGRLHQAETVINKIQQDFDRQGVHDSPEAYFLHRHLGYIFYLRNQLGKARECIDRAVRYCEDCGLREEIMAGDEFQLMIYLAQGDKEQTEAYQKRLYYYSAKYGIPQFSAGLKAITARVAMEQGSLAPAVLWARRRKLRADEPFSLIFAMEAMLQIRLHLAQKAYQKALDLLESLRDRCRKRGLLEIVLHIDILRSAAYHALDDQEKAKSILREALTFSETEGYVRPFVNDAKIIAPVLSILLKASSGSFSSHVEKVLTACQPPIDQSRLSNVDETASSSNLTQREIEILEWMAQGYKNKEISQKAYVSVSTVKTHVHRILAKLEVQTRTQAVLKAKRMKIIKN